MNNLERAKQFMPFDARKGLREALKEREERRTRVEKKELSEDVIASISSALYRLVRGDSVRLTFFRRGHYIDIEGEVSSVDSTYLYLKIGDEKIYFDDIIDIKIL